MSEPLLLEAPKPRKLENGEVVQNEAPPQDFPHHPYLPDEVILEALRSGESLYKFSFNTFRGSMSTPINWKVRIHT